MAKKPKRKGHQVVGNTKHRLKVRVNDLYETPAEGTVAIVKAIGADLPDVLWEPACGPGAMVRVLRASGRVVYATDLIDYKSRDQDMSRIDFLMERQVPIGVKGIIMNPPYKLAAEFVAHALELCPKVYALLRLNFLEAGNLDNSAGIARRRVLDEGMLERVLVFKNRLPMMHRHGWTGKKAGSGIAFAWYCWNANHSGPAALSRISWEQIPEADYKRYRPNGGEEETAAPDKADAAV